MPKAPEGEDFRRMLQYGVHPMGHRLADHRLHLENAPAGVRGVHDFFQKRYLAAKRKPRRVEDTTGGCSPKLFYNLSENEADNARSKYRLFMIKPYHEQLDGCNYQYYPSAGWGEMTTQAIFHAGGLADYHQKVFTYEQTIITEVGKEVHPMIAVAFEPNMLDAEDARGSVRYKLPPKLGVVLAKVGFLDFLVSNNDRHGGNLLYRTTRGAFSHFLCIDHGRNFQYRCANRWVEPSPKRDSPLYYLSDSPAFDYLKDAGVRIAYKKYIEPTVRWWGEHSDEIRKAFDLHVGAIVDPHAAEWIRSNFHARADVLDRFSAQWPKCTDLEHRSFTVPVAKHEPHPRFIDTAW